MQEIHEAIQRADAVVFVLSPDSASSPVCGIEVDQALAEGKRIIPVVVRDVHPDDVAPSSPSVSGSASATTSTRRPMLSSPCSTSTSTR